MTTTYNSDDAHRFIAARSGEGDETVAVFLEASFRYLPDRTGALNTHSDARNATDATVDEVYVEELEVSTASLVRARDFIAKATSLPRLTVARLLAEELGYFHSIGWIPREVYQNSKDWAAASPWPEADPQ